ncbi:MAG: GIY-YIG nuclease family protein [Spirochaetia bacterium]|nr:GIY-YIG nuclease family protein [Spirochaetia bacterium]
MYFVYLLKCVAETYYTGMTKNLTNKIYEHKRGEGVYTKSRLPIEIVYKEKFEDEKDAVKREKQIKNWSRNKKKALIDENYNELKKIGKKNF